MTRRIEATPTFEKNLKRLAQRYRRIREDLEPILDALAAGQTLGDRIQGAQAVVYKVRVPNSDTRKGKSGGYRMIYYLPSDVATVLLTIYSKTDQADIPADEIVRILDTELGS